MTNQQNSPHWIDKLATGILAWQKKADIKKLHVDDMKTPSGRVHTGALRGVLLHDFVAKALAENTDQKVTNTYVFNDMDPMDGLPNYLDKAEYEQHMGKPMYKIPAPALDKCGIDLSKASAEELADFKKAKNFAEVYAFDFIHAFRKLGCDQEIVWSHELYESGQMNDAIRTALDSIDELKKVYKDVADYDLPEKWFPFQVFCPECGKVGTTLVTDWDGEEVTFECQPNKVEWAKGCGYAGKISPFDGNGKLLWKVDWPAHWKTLGITVEGAGKDHTSAGGSRDMANEQCKQVFDIPIPFNIPYEWILIRGAKMSSSKGVGTSAREFTELFPPEVGRFLFVNKHYNQVIDFDPTTMSIPDLFDEYDTGARIYWGEEQGDQRLGRAFELSQINKTPKSHFLPRFRDVAIWMQHPELDLVEKFTEIKGSKLTDQEKQLIEDRKGFAQVWINRYAPVDFQLTPSSELPEKATTLSNEQLEYLEKAIDLTQSKQWNDPQDLQQALFELAKESIGPRPAFQSIYLGFIGKTHGPRAAWFLLSIDTDILNSRIKDIRKSQQHQAQQEYIYDLLDDSSLISIDPEYAQKYPSTTVGVAVIEGVSIEQINEELEKEKESLANNLKDLTPKEVNDFDEIQSYKKLYEESGVNWSERKSSPAALLIRASQGKGTPTINTCVDAYNLAVMKNRVSAGAFDMDKFEFPVVLKESQGGETIEVIGEDEPITLNKGEICYFDQNGPYNLDFNFRDAIRTQVTTETKNLFINVEGIYDISREQVEKTLQEVIDNITKYCCGRVKVVGILEAREA